jgi:hypothetical protein
MSVIHYWPGRKKRDFSRLLIIFFSLMTITLFAGVCIILHNRGPSEDEVNGWLANLPANSTRQQVKLLFANKKILWGGEDPLNDGSGFTCIRGYVTCEGDRAIFVIVDLDKEGIVKIAHAREGWRGP